eukprot:Nitzschia sp. Nitz4//scaffold208_size52459//41762//47777//NITZ4_006818-RA/size52459-augustus-gene-0.8-mRNA-1//-1//CDS//3329541675//1540//frame0
MTVRNQPDNWLTWIPQSVHNKCRDQATVRELAKANSRLYQAKQLTDREYWEVSHLLWLHQAEADGYTPRQLLHGVHQLVARAAQPVKDDSQVYIFQWILPFADLLLPSLPQGDERQQLLAFWNNWFTLATSSKAGAAFPSPPPSKRTKRALSPDILVTVTFLTALLVYVSIPADGEPTMTNAMTWELLEQKVMNYHYVFRESYVSHLQAAWTLVGVQYVVDHPATFFTRLPGLDPCVLVQSWMQYTGAGILAEFKRLFGLPFYSIKALLVQLLLESILVEEGMTDSSKQETIDKLTDFLNGESADTYIDETLAKQEGSSGIETTASGSKRSRSDSATGVGSPLPDEFTSPYFPLRVHIDLWMRKSQWIRAVPCARKIESKAYVDYEFKQDVWVLIWLHLFCANIFLLDDNHRDSYIYNRRRDILYDEVVAKMGPVGRDITQDYYESIAALVWNHPTATLEERSYVLIACQQTLLRLMLKWKGLGSDTTDYFLKESQWPVQLTSSSKDSYDWAIRFLMQKVPIPPSLIKLQGIDKTPVPDLNRFYDGSASASPDESEEIPVTTPAALPTTEEPPSVEEVAEDSPEEAYEIVEDEENTEEMVDTPTLPSEMINDMDDEEEPKEYGYLDNEDDAEVVEDVDEVYEVNDDEAEGVDAEAVEDIDDDAEEYYQDGAAGIAPSPSVIEMLDDSDDGSDTRDETEPMSGGDVDRYSSDDDDASREENVDQESVARAALEENAVEDDRVTDTHSEAVSVRESEVHSDQEESHVAYPTPPPTNYHASSDDMLEADEQTEEDQGTELSELEDPEGSKEIPAFSGASEMEGSALLDFAQSAQSRYEGVEHKVGHDKGEADTVEVTVVPAAKRQVYLEHANDADVDTEEIDDEGDTEDQDQPSRPTEDMAEESHSVLMTEEAVVEPMVNTEQGNTDEQAVEEKTTCQTLRNTIAEIGAEKDAPQEDHGDVLVEEPPSQVDNGRDEDTKAVGGSEDPREPNEAAVALGAEDAAVVGDNTGGSVLSGEFADVDEARSQTSILYEATEDNGATNVAISGISEVFSPTEPESADQGAVSQPPDPSLMENTVEQGDDAEPVVAADEEEPDAAQPPEDQVESKAAAVEELPEDEVAEEAVTEQPIQEEVPDEALPEEKEHPVEEEAEVAQPVAEDADTEQEPSNEMPNDSKPSDETDLPASASPVEETPVASEAPIVAEDTDVMETAGTMVVQPQSPENEAPATPATRSTSLAPEKDVPPTATDVSAEVPDKVEPSHVTEVPMSETPVADDHEDATMTDLDPNAPSPDDPLPPSPPTVPIASEMSVEGIQSVPADDTMDEDHTDQVVPMDSSEPVYAMEESPQRTDYSMETDFVAEDMEAEADTKTVETQQMVTDGAEKEVPMEAEVPPPVPDTVIPIVKDTEMELKPALQDMESTNENEKSNEVPRIEQDEEVDEKNHSTGPKDDNPSVLETIDETEVLETPRRSRRSRRNQGNDMASTATLETVPETEPASKTEKWTELEVAQATATSPLVTKALPDEGAATDDETPLRRGSRTTKEENKTDTAVVSDKGVDQTISEDPGSPTEGLAKPSEKDDAETEEEGRTPRIGRKSTKSIKATTRKSRSTRGSKAEDDDESVDASKTSVDDTEEATPMTRRTTRKSRTTRGSKAEDDDESVDASKTSVEATVEATPMTRRSTRKSRSTRGSKAEDDDESVDASKTSVEATVEATPMTRRTTRKSRSTRGSKAEDDDESVDASKTSVEVTEEATPKTRRTTRKSRSTRGSKAEDDDESVDASKTSVEVTEEATPKTRRTTRKSRSTRGSKAEDDDESVDASKTSVEATVEATPRTRRATKKPQRYEDDIESVDASIDHSVDTTDDAAPKTRRTTRKSRTTRASKADDDNAAVEAPIDAEAESKAKKGTPVRKSKRRSDNEVEDTDDRSTSSGTQNKRKNSKRGAPAEEETDAPSTPRTGTLSKRRKAADQSSA